MCWQVLQVLIGFVFWWGIRGCGVDYCAGMMVKYNAL
jgi:hypothetical protein